MNLRLFAAALLATSIFAGMSIPAAAADQSNKSSTLSSTSPQQTPHGVVGDDVAARFDDLSKRLSESEKRTDDDVKTRFDELDKRIDDVKWFIGGITGLFTIVFGLVAFLGNQNFNSEKAQINQALADYKKEVTGQLGTPPQIDLLGANGSPLQSQEVSATFHQAKSPDQKEILQLVISFTLRNSGESLSGPMYISIYTTEPILLSSRSTDEPRFSYVANLTPDDLHPSEIPGRYQFESRYNLGLKTQEKPPGGRYAALAKVFYGQGKVAQADFFILVKPAGE